MLAFQHEKNRRNQSMDNVGGGAITGAAAVAMRNKKTYLCPVVTHSSAPMGEIHEVSLHITSDAEKLKSSVCLVEDIRPFDKGEPHPNGLYDLRMGPSDLKHLCATCHGNLHECPKHNGHILFLRYKYQVCFLKHIWQILNSVCHNCHQIRIAPDHPAYIRALSMENSQDRLSELYNHCRKVDYCGGVAYDPETHMPVREFLQYLEKRKRDPIHTPYRGCGALQRVYVTSKKEPLNIRCFERIPPVKKRKSHKRTHANEERSDGMDEDIDAEEEEDEEENEPLADEEEEPELEEELGEELEEEGDLEEMDIEEEVEDDVDAEELLAQEGEAGEVEDQDLEDDVEEEDEIEDPEIEAEMNQMLEDIALQTTKEQEGADEMEDLDEKKPEASSTVAQQTRESSVGDKIQSTPKEQTRYSFLDTAGPVTQSHIPLKFNQLSDWFKRHSRTKEQLAMIPFCSVATMRGRVVSDKIKHSLPPFYDSEEYMFTPSETYGIFSGIAKHDFPVLGFGGQTFPSNLCFRVMAIVPAAVQMRSFGASGDSLKYHDDSDIIKNLRHILSVSRDLKTTHEQVLRAVENNQPVHELYKKMLLHEDLLQLLTAAYVNRDQSGIAHSAAGRNKVPSRCVVQSLLGKGGRVRGGLYAKRVNFSGRDTIAPGAGYDVNEAGMPIVMCMKITQLETVNRYNIKELQALVDNGPWVYPGAKKIWKLDGTQIDLQFANAGDRMLQIGWIVERHQSNKDMSIFNRQPSLHRPSMMGHRIVPHFKKVIKIPTQSTTPYGADFDGDEMNAHLVQDPKARAEVSDLMNVTHQLITQQDRAILGAKQNGIVISNQMTDTRRFYTKQHIFNTVAQLRYYPLQIDRDIPKSAQSAQSPLSSSSPSIENSPQHHLPLPCIFVWNALIHKWETKWSGKQMFSLCLPRTFSYRHGELSEVAVWNNQYVYVQQGQLLCGQITGDHVAAARGCMWQEMAYDHGSTLACKALSEHSRIISYRCDYDAFSALAQDLNIPNEIVKAIRHTSETALRRITQKAMELTRQKQQLPFHDAVTCNANNHEYEIVQELDKLTTEVGRLALEHCQIQQQSTLLCKSNTFHTLVVSKTKGTPVHLIQAVVSLGQTRTQGKRNRPVCGTRAFPHFPPHCLTPQSRGYVEECYHRGTRSIGTFCNSQSGGEGMSQSSTVIANVGYLQRRLTMAQGDQIQHYDHTVRSVKEISSFVHGEEGYDTNTLHRQLLPWLNWSQARLRRTFYNDMGLSKQDAEYEFDRIRHYIDRLRCFKIQCELIQEDLKAETLPADVKLPVLFQKIVLSARYKFFHHLTPDHQQPLVRDAITQWLSSYPSRAFLKEIWARPDQRIQSFHVCQITQAIHVVTQKMIGTPTPRIKFNTALWTFLSSKIITQEHGLTNFQFMLVAYQIVQSFVRGLSHPGEMVGITAAQNASEPSAQMMLQSFHLPGSKGRDEQFTFSRVEELMRKATNIKQSLLRVPIQNALRKSKVTQLLLQRHLTHQTLEFFVHYVRIEKRVPSDKIRLANDRHNTLCGFSRHLHDLCNKSKFTKPLTGFSGMGGVGALHPTQLYSPFVLILQLNKSKLLEYGFNLHDVLHLMARRFKHSSHLHEWYSSPLHAKMWSIELRLCCKSKEFLSFWKKTNPKVKKHQAEESNVASLPKESLFFTEEEQHLKVMQHLKHACLSMTVLGDPNISHLSIEDSHVWRPDPKTGIMQRHPCSMLYMKGTKIQALLKTPCLDVSHLYCNNIVEVEKLCDVHAAGWVTMRELKRVYQFNSQYVNDSHYREIIAFMSKKGRLRAFTRNGFNEDSNLGFLKKMSFEKIVPNIMNAAHGGQVDRLENVMGPVFIGKPAPIGTGLCKIQSVSQALNATSPTIRNPAQINLVVDANDAILKKRLVPQIKPIYSDKALQYAKEGIVPDYSFLQYTADSHQKDPTHGPAPNNTNAASFLQSRQDQLMAHIHTQSQKIAQSIKVPPDYRPMRYYAIPLVHNDSMRQHSKKQVVARKKTVRKGRS